MHIIGFNIFFSTSYSLEVFAIKVELKLHKIIKEREVIQENNMITVMIVMILCFIMLKGKKLCNLDNINFVFMYKSNKSQNVCYTLKFHDDDILKLHREF